MKITIHISRHMFVFELHVCFILLLVGRRFSFALFYHTSATIAMLDGFEQADLFDVLKRSAALFNDLLPAPSFFYCSLTEAVLYAWKNFQTENIISHLTSHDQNLKLVQVFKHFLFFLKCYCNRS